MAKRKNKARGLGARYGVRLRKKISSFLVSYKKKQKCPYCMKTKVKRAGRGIWQCKRCSAKFTGKAYAAI